MSGKTTKATATASKKGAKKLTKEDILNQKIADPKYSNQMYSAAVSVSLPGVLFAECMKQNYANQGLLQTLRNSLIKQLEVIDEAIERQMVSNDMHSLNLVEKHVDFVDNGLTKPAGKEVLEETEKA